MMEDRMDVGMERMEGWMEIRKKGEFYDESWTIVVEAFVSLSLFVSLSRCSHCLYLWLLPLYLHLSLSLFVSFLISSPLKKADVFRSKYWE